MEEALGKIFENDVICNKCGEPMDLRSHDRITNKLLQKSYFFQFWYYCKPCKNTKYFEKYKIKNFTKKRKKPKNYKYYLSTKWWKYRRRKYWATHKKICYCCEKEATELHHNNYKCLFHEQDKDLVPLCRDCHEEIHTLILNDKQITLVNGHEVYKSLLLLEI